MNFDDNISPLEDEKFLSCSLCDKQFTNEKRYFGHLRIHSGEVSWCCERCPASTMIFDSQSRLRNHENAFHALVRPYKCDKCEDTFDRASQLDYHIRGVHLREKSQICQICGKGFFRKNDLRTHLNVHLGTNQLICEICGRKFNHVSNLIRHCRTHAGAKPYPCAFCGKRFTQISSLARHKRIHERESKESSINAEEETDEGNGERIEKKRISKRQHYCRICGESFEFIVLLRQHKRLHANIRETGNEREKMTNIHENIDVTTENDLSENLIRNHLMELASKMNSIETETERDVSISISDILSPYNCDAIELSNSVDGLEEKDIEQCLNAVNFQTSVDSDLSNSSANKSEAANSTEARVANLKSYVEMCESEYFENSHILENGETTKVDEDEKNEEEDLRIEQNNEMLRLAKIDIAEPTLRLVKTETGEQFYELVVNNPTNENFVNHSENRIEEESTLRLENSRNSSISIDDCPTMEKLNFDKFIDEPDPSEIGKLSPNIDNNRDATMQNDTSQMPMVRLVQNEDGEQFFELIREPLDYERNRTLDNREKNPDTASTLNEETKVCETTKRQTSINSNVGRKEKKDNGLENGTRATKDRGRKFKCTECEKSFSTSYNFKQHAGTHFSDQQKFQCKECGLMFAWKSTLNKHLAGNHRPDGPQKFVCEICPKVYSTLSQVNEHVKRDHLKERNHVCTLCGKSFFKKFDLKTHARTHTNERPYICRACGKGFHHQSHIIRHERIHSGERPYECDICQRTFTQPGSLKSHRQRHRDVKIDILEYRMDEDDPLTLAVQ